MFIKKIFLILTILFAVSIFSCKVQRTNNDNTFDSFIKNKADSLYKTEKLPGIFIGVLNNGKRKYYSFGYADPEKKMPFDSATSFEIGSLTKTFTAYVLENVLKEKGISDTSYIFEYLPDSVQKNKALEKISFLTLLNHTSGLPRLPDNIDLMSKQPYENYDINKLFTYLKTCKPKPPGDYDYSNLGFGLAGVLSSIINKRSYAAMLDEYIFLPFRILERRDSTEAAERKSKGFFGSEVVEYWKFDALAGAGALKLDASEILNWFQLMSDPIGTRPTQIIDKLLEPTIALTSKTKVCRAWHTLVEQDKPAIYWHNGGTYGFSTFGGFIKSERKAVIVVVNQFNKNTVSDGLGIEIMERMSQNP